MTPDSSSASGVGRMAPSSISTLRGRWLLLARVGWVAVLLTVVVLNLKALPDTYGSYFTFSPSVMQDLHRLGLSPALYGILQTVVNAPLQLVYLALGLLLFWRRSDDRVALLCSFTFVTFGGMLPLFDFYSGTLVPSLATSTVLRAVALVLLGIGEASLVVFFYVFPSGRFAPRWTRWGALGISAYWLGVVFFPTALTAQDAGLLPFLVPLSWLSAAVAQVSRYRRVSTPRERQQTKWAVFGLALAVLFLLVTIPISFLVVPSSIQNNPLYGSLNPIFQVALLFIPIFIAIAVLRARLWDIDTVINRTLVYGSLTGLLGALYAGLIIGLETLAEAITTRASESVVLVVSTLAIAALVQPVRTRLQALIDRRFYRKKYDEAKTLAAFSATLRNEVDLEQIRAQVLAVVQETMQPAYVSLWLRPAEQPFHPDRQDQVPSRSSPD